MKATASVHIDRPIADVFAVLTDVSHMPSWVNGVKSARLVSEAMDEGAKYVLEYSSGWRANELEVEVTEFRPPEVFASTTVRGPFAFEGTFTLVEEAGGTRLTNFIEAGPDSVASRVASLLLGWLLRGTMSRRLLSELETLQRTIEGDPSLRSA